MRCQASACAEHATDRLVDVASGRSLGWIVRAPAVENQADSAASGMKPPSIQHLSEQRA
jgi:hypothetical protein